MSFPVDNLVTFAHDLAVYFTVVSLSQSLVTQATTRVCTEKGRMPQGDVGSLYGRC